MLRRALNVALRQRMVGRNVALGVELPVTDEFAGDPLSIADARSLLERTSSDRLGALWRLALVTGLRQGELLGLSWDDIDLEGGMITVNAQLSRLDGAWIRVAPKAGRRIDHLAIDEGTVAAMRAHQRRQAAERQADWPYWGLVFVTPRGMPIGRSEALRTFHRACDTAGIRRRRFHDLRGSSATLLRELGVDEDTRMARLGHNTRAMARHYARASEIQDREAVRRLAEAIG